MPELSGAPWFDSIDFVPGDRKRLAGKFVATLSSAARAVIADPRWSGTTTVSVSEFRRLGTVPGILLYLLFKRLIREQPNAHETTLRWGVEDVYGLCGQYCLAARSKKRLASGDESETLSLSRVTSVLLRPGIADIVRGVDDLLIGLVEVRAAAAGRGTAWRRIDIVFSPLGPRPTLRDLNEAVKASAECRERKHK